MAPGSAKEFTNSMPHRARDIKSATTVQVKHSVNPPGPISVAERVSKARQSAGCSVHGAKPNRIRWAPQCVRIHATITSTTSVTRTNVTCDRGIRLPKRRVGVSSPAHQLNAFAEQAVQHCRHQIGQHQHDRHNHQGLQHEGEPRKPQLDAVPPTQEPLHRPHTNGRGRPGLQVRCVKIGGCLLHPTTRPASSSAADRRA